MTDVVKEQEKQKYFACIQQENQNNKWLCTQETYFASQIKGFRSDKFDRAQVTLVADNFRTRWPNGQTSLFKMRPKSISTYEIDPKETELLYPCWAQEVPTDFPRFWSCSNIAYPNWKFDKCNAFCTFKPYFVYARFSKQDIQTFGAQFGEHDATNYFKEQMSKI
jgi:hypothetical protein